ncbi:transposase, Ptta/En/Spm, transposase, Tnp1/En/Spm-like protein [Tanacetum coccineum]
MMVELCSPVLHCAINTSPSQSFPKPLQFIPILFSLAMAARGGRNNIVARRVIDDLIDINGERSPPKYLKIFIEQQITDHHRFIARMRDEIRTSTNLISQLNASIVEVYVADFNRVDCCLRKKIHGREIDLEMLAVVVGCAIREYGKPDGIKLSVTFDALNRISGKHRALFLSFLGDMRYFDVDLTVRKLVMNRLGQLLGNFRRKLRQPYILPNQNILSKLNEVPAKYSVILQAEEWVNFVKYTATEEYKVKSAAAKMARSKSVYQHTMGRGGYALVKEKMIEKKEIEPDEEPARGTLWLKGRVNKDGEYPDDEIRSVGDKLKETEDKIKEGTLKVDHGTDAMTVVLGKEKGGYARGVGSGVTYKRYFDLPRSRQASDERILLLQSQLDNERRERQEKELLIQNLSNKMSQTEGMVTKLKNQLAAHGGQSQSMSTQLTPPNVSPVDINPINSSADEWAEQLFLDVRMTRAFRSLRDLQLWKRKWKQG